MMNKEQVLKAIENGDLEVNWEFWDYEDEHGHKLARHELLEDGEPSLYEVLYPEHEDLQELREDLMQAEDEADYVAIERIKAEIDDRISGVERNDVFDYDAEPSVLFDGQYI